MKSTAAACVSASVDRMNGDVETGTHSDHIGTPLLPASYCCLVVKYPVGGENTSVGVCWRLAKTSASSLSSAPTEGSIAHFRNDGLTVDGEQKKTSLGEIGSAHLKRHLSPISKHNHNVNMHYIKG